MISATISQWATDNLIDFVVIQQYAFNDLCRSHRNIIHVATSRIRRARGPHPYDTAGPCLLGVILQRRSIWRRVWRITLPKARGNGALLRQLARRRRAFLRISGMPFDLFMPSGCPLLIRCLPSRQSKRRHKISAIAMAPVVICRCDQQLHRGGVRCRQNALDQTKKMSKSPHRFMSVIHAASPHRPNTFDDTFHEFDSAMPKKDASAPRTGIIRKVLVDTRRRQRQVRLESPAPIAPPKTQHPKRSKDRPDDHKEKTAHESAPTD